MDQASRVASARLYWTLVRDRLNLPEGTQIIGADWDCSCQCVRLYVIHESLPVVPEGAIVPEAKIEFQKITSKFITQ